jgi:hypothetical protein
MEETTYLTVKGLIEKLQEFDENMPLVITNDGKGHHYGIIKENIKVVDYAYFGNDYGAEKTFPCYDEETEEELEVKFLNLGYF